MASSARLKGQGEKATAPHKRRGNNSSNGSAETPLGKLGSRLAATTLGEVGALAADALRVAKQALAELNAEEKAFDVVGGPTAPITPFAANAFGQGTILDNPAQGVADNQREGDSLEGRSLDIIFRVTQATTTNTLSTKPTTFRIMVVRDREPAGGATLIAGNYETQLFATSGSAQLMFVSPQGYDFEPRYSILYDEIVTLVPSSTLVEKTWTVPIRHKEKIHFNGGTQNSTTSNTQLFWIGMDASTGAAITAANASCSFSYYSRFRYVDN